MMKHIEKQALAKILSNSIKVSKGMGSKGSLASKVLQRTDDMAPLGKGLRDPLGGGAQGVLQRGIGDERRRALQQLRLSLRHDQSGVAQSLDRHNAYSQAERGIS